MACLLSATRSNGKTKSTSGGFARKVSSGMAIAARWAMRPGVTNDPSSFTIASLVSRSFIS